MKKEWKVVKMFLNDGVRDVDNVEVGLKEALEEMGTLPPHSDKINSFIGFERGEEEICQFIKFGEDDWLIDTPIIKKEICKYTMQADHLTIEQVKVVVIRFFGGGDDWKDVLMWHKNRLGFWNQDTSIDGAWAVVGVSLFIILYAIPLASVYFYPALVLDVVILILSGQLLISDVREWVEGGETNKGKVVRA